MENPDDLFNHIKNVLGAAPESMKILEDTISIDVQMEYYKRASNIRNAEVPISFIADDLYSKKLTPDEVKEYLIHLAGSNDVENFRLIEEYSVTAPDELKEWALMALNECRFHLISSLSDENGVFISTGLGGKGSKLRYFIVFVPNGNGLPMEMKQMVTDEVNFIFPRYSSEVESIEILEDFICTMALVPMNVAVNEPIKAVIDECLSLGCSLSNGYIVTNVKQLSLNEINGVLNGDSIEELSFDEE